MSMRMMSSVLLLLVLMTTTTTTMTETTTDTAVNTTITTSTSTTNESLSKSSSSSSSSWWNVEQVWETKDITTTDSRTTATDAGKGPWPLWTPRRTQKTVLLKLTLNTKTSRISTTTTTSSTGSNTNANASTTNHAMDARITNQQEEQKEVAHDHDSETQDSVDIVHQEAHFCRITTTTNNNNNNEDNHVDVLKDNHRKDNTIRTITPYQPNCKNNLKMDHHQDHPTILRRHMEEVIAGDEFTPTEDELSVEVTYEDLYDTLIFLVCTWIAGHVALYMGMPTLVGEIVIGFLLGPPLANYVPQPEAMVLIGEIGLIGLLVEAGIDMDVAQLKETGTRSFVMACTGATLPMVLGIGLAFAAGLDIRAAIALGACFSPTSLGVASNALNAGNVLNTPVGQLIVSTCVIDDIIGLVILSMLEVIVNEDAEIYEYFIPIISSVGLMAVLGWSGLTWFPRFIENWCLPKFPERFRDTIAFLLMMGLTLAYVPTLKYSRSSYLTGAFLAGLTFSQMHSIHVSWAANAGQIMNWLLRIFFAASIGFQVPIKNFADGFVIEWGLAFFICVLAKLPLGLFVPRFDDAVPDGFPYNPSRRDMVYVSVAMTCRGEFSFVIASFALAQGLFTSQVYSAVVFAILLSSITSPFALLSIIKYYNRKSQAFLANMMLAEADGKMPLYLAIQIRTPNQWGLQETIHSTLKLNDLIVIDHRSWHPRGIDAIVMTELYVEDPDIRVPLQGMKAMSSVNLMANMTPDGEVDPEPTNEATIGQVMEIVETRCTTVKKALEDVMGHADQTRIVVTWWQPTTVTSTDGVPHYDKADEDMRDRLKTEAQSELTTHETFNISLPQAQQLQLQRSRRHDRMITPLMGQDLWATDATAQQAAFSDAMVASPLPSTYRVRRKIQSDLTGFLAPTTLPSTEEHLAGFVRREIATTPTTDFGLLHPGTSDAQAKHVKADETRRIKTKSDLTGFFGNSSGRGGQRGSTIGSSNRFRTSSDVTGLFRGNGNPSPGVEIADGIAGEAIAEEKEEDKGSVRETPHPNFGGAGVRGGSV